MKRKSTQALKDEGSSTEGKGKGKARQAKKVKAIEQEPVVWPDYFNSVRMSPPTMLSSHVAYLQVLSCSRYVMQSCVEDALNGEQ